MGWWESAVSGGRRAQGEAGEEKEEDRASSQAHVTGPVGVRSKVNSPCG